MVALEGDGLKRLVLAVSGASGAIYAVRMMKFCLESELECEVVASRYGRLLLKQECGLDLNRDPIGEWIQDRYGWVEHTGRINIHRADDMEAPLASGSCSWDSMVVIPCSMKTLSALARGAASNLIERAADVTLKERRRLVVVPRETPLNLIHIENMKLLTMAGAIVAPAMPAFYQKPGGIVDIADFMAGRVLSLLGIENELYRPWQGTDQ